MFYVRISGLHPFLLSCVGTVRALSTDAMLCGRDEQGHHNVWWQQPGSNAAALWRAERGERDPLSPHRSLPPPLYTGMDSAQGFALRCNIRQQLQKSMWQIHPWWEDIQFDILSNAIGQKRSIYRICTMKILFTVLRRSGNRIFVSH